jgi:hypothetical protein
MGLLAGMLVAAGTANALEEQRGALPANAPEAAKSQVQEETDSAKDDGGTEIRIPGLGKLGTLPKMDFGLELLYGAEDPPLQQNAEPPENEQQDLMIRGTVRHSF